MLEWNRNNNDNNMLEYEIMIKKLIIANVLSKKW